MELCEKRDELNNRVEQKVPGADAWQQIRVNLLDVLSAPLKAPVISAEILMSSQKVLAEFREGGAVKLLKVKQRRKGPAYGMLSINTGGMLGLMGGIRAGFKNVGATEVDKVFNSMIADFTGMKSLGDTFKVDYEGMHSPAYATVTTECPNYSRGSADVLNEKRCGVDGNSGWQFILSLRPIMTLRPLIVEYEMVAHAVNVHNGREVWHVLKTLQTTGYIVRAALVEMKAYGDLVNKERLMIVGCSTDLGVHALEYKIPVGDFSDAVSYCARDIIEKSLDESLMRFFPDKPEEPRSELPGTLQVVARMKNGHGFSARPNASVSLEGLLPSATRFGSGRHQPLSWKPGDPVGKSYMFSEQTAAKAQNVSEDYIPYLKSFCKDENRKETVVMEAVAMGLGQRFALAMSTAAHQVLLLAGVPFDVLSTKTKIVLDMMFLCQGVQSFSNATRSRKWLLVFQELSTCSYTTVASTSCGCETCYLRLD